MCFVLVLISVILLKNPSVIAAFSVLSVPAALEVRLACPSPYRHLTGVECNKTTILAAPKLNLTHAPERYLQTKTKHKAQQN